MATNKRLIKSNEGGAAVPTSFNTVLYTGTGATNPVTGVGFQPDFVWLKKRSGVDDHFAFDSVRGAKSIYPNLTNAEDSFPFSFNTDGFTVPVSGGTNGNGDTFVAWCWKAGGAAVTNTDGTITSQVSANVAAGFSIVSYTGNQLSNQTIGHGLGKTPDMIITKGRANLSLYDQWDVWHKDLTLNYVLFLNNTDAQGFAGVDQRFVTSLNSDTVFGVGWDDFGPNSNGTTKIAYCFAEVPGFSKFGSYTGNGSTSGPTITTGFEPAFVMIKCSSDSGTNWTIWDNKRDTTNPITNFLQPNNSGTEATGREIDFNPSSFQLKSTGVNENQSGLTFIYMAFANQF